eukprot:TRINITY_DN1008_c0_g2_i1.p1 TRINITY_DN1008_c0_g2~~TRINITY_DN1008_c0_g2_i1.p1  ORF type:complete len:833 (+),score=198.07 TRINITY_DN1008_c0_g2_i1:387-2885(+)
MEFFKELDRLEKLFFPGGTTSLQQTILASSSNELKKGVLSALQHVPITISWGTIFHNGLTARRDVLSQEKMVRYEQLISAFITQIQKKQRHSEECKRAQELLDYLHTHRMDPDNSLLGLRPSESVLRKYCTSLLKSKPLDLSQSGKKAPTLKENVTVDVSSEALIQKILEWDELADDVLGLTQEIRSFAELLRTNHQFKVGDIVLAYLPTGRAGSRISGASGSPSSPQSIPSTTSSTTTTQTPTQPTLTTTTATLNSPTQERTPLSPKGTRNKPVPPPSLMNPPSSGGRLPVPNEAEGGSPGGVGVDNGTSNGSVCPSLTTSTATVIATVTPINYLSTSQHKTRPVPPPPPPGARSPPQCSPQLQPPTITVALTSDGTNGATGKLPEFSRNIFYCRIVKLHDGEVTLQVSEGTKAKDVSGIPLSNVLRFPYPLRVHLGNANRMKQLVTDPVEPFLAKIRDSQQANINEFLSANKLDTTFLTRAAERSVTLADSRQVSVSISEIMKLQEDKRSELQALDQSLALRGQAECQKFWRSIDTSQTFVPNLEEVVHKSFVGCASVLLREMTSRLVMSLEFLNIEREMLLSGRRKRELTDWWLGLVDSAVRGFLVARGFDFNVVPANYCDEPPSSLEAVHSNLRIVQNVILLASTAVVNGGINTVRNFVSRLAHDIYVRIDEFVRNVRALVCELAGVDLSELPLGPPASSASDSFKSEASTASMLQNVLKQKKERIQKETRVQIKELMRDYEYIVEMKRLEIDAEDVNGGGKLQLSTAVPVRGLIFGSFVRLEKELNTVVEIWEPRLSSSSTLSSSSQSRAPPPPPPPPPYTRKLKRG